MLLAKTKLVRVVSYLLIFLPVAIAFFYVNRFGVTAVYRDQWEMVVKFRHLTSGGFDLAELWEPHNAHRFFFPRLAMLALGSLTRWNNVAEMYLILVCLLVTLGCLLLAFGVSPGARAALFVPVAFLVFNLGRHKNLLWGYQITFAFTQVFGVLTLFLLYLFGRSSSGKLLFLAALVSGALTAGSSIQGLLVWPVGLLQMLISPVQRFRKWVLAGTWALTGTAIWIFYFVDYQRSGDVSSSLLAQAASPVAGFRHFLTLIGRSLFYSQRRELVLIFGALLLLFAAWSLFLVYRSNRLGGYSFWIGLMLLSLAILASITVGRSGNGIANAMASRYVTFSILFTASVYGMLAKLALENGLRSATVPFGVLLAVVMLSMPGSYKNGLAEGRITKDSREEAATILLNYDTAPEEQLGKLWPRKGSQDVRPRAAQLERLEYNVFATSHGEERSP